MGNNKRQLQDVVLIALKRKTNGIPYVQVNIPALEPHDIYKLFALMFSEVAYQLKEDPRKFAYNCVFELTGDDQAASDNAMSAEMEV